MSYGEMFEMRKTLDARIHNNLARRLNALGYTVEVAEHGFRLREVPVVMLCELNCYVIWRATGQVQSVSDWSECTNVCT